MNEQRDAKGRFQILSLDGGGLKGIFTAAFLSHIEEHAGVRLTDCFDLIAGTSTGGIIALGLGLGFAPRDLLEFYRNEGPEIFPAQNRLKRCFRNAFWLFFRKYPSEPLRSALDRYFGNRMLGESLRPLVIPSFNFERGEVHIYKTPHHRSLKFDYKVPVKDVALHTASAPSYLPMSISDAGVQLIDGGIWANNPTMVALVEALGYFGQPKESIAVLSIGTTRGPEASRKTIFNGGLWTWRKKAIEFLMRGQSIMAQNAAFHVLDNDRFLRVNPEVSKEYPLDRLISDLEGLGYSEARLRINAIERMFLGHKARRYEPVYKLNNGSN